MIKHNFFSFIVCFEHYPHISKIYVKQNVPVINANKIKYKHYKALIQGHNYRIIQIVRNVPCTSIASAIDSRIFCSAIC